MIKILIADDHMMFREGLKQILSKQADIIVLDEAGNASELIEKVRREDFDVILLDIAMPGRDGIDALKEIKQLKPDLPILVLSMYPEDQYAVRAIKAGASGYLTKNRAGRELIAALQKVALGKKYISPDVGEQLASELERDTDQAVHQTLSDREYQVMCMIASGRTVKQISEELSLSVSTISTNRARLLKKMNLKNNAEVTHYAIKHGLVE
jgi:two-component system, NarL family, invasion response regulator UvrY